MSDVARYDGYSEWYDETFSAYDTREEEDFLRHALGVGGGDTCLDVACGTGRYGPIVVNAGYHSVGFDISADQLRFARQRLDASAQADARHLPVRDRAVGVAVGMFFHTDVEDFAAAARDIARCLRPGGRFIYIGLHPCYIGRFVDRTTEAQDLELNFVTGYAEVGWANRGSGGGGGLWARVGGHHKTLASFLSAIADAPLNIRAVHEFSGGGVVLPRNLGVVAEKA